MKQRGEKERKTKRKKRGKEWTSSPIHNLNICNIISRVGEGQLDNKGHGIMRRGRGRGRERGRGRGRRECSYILERT